MELHVMNPERITMLQDLAGGGNDLIRELIESFTRLAETELDAFKDLSDPSMQKVLREKIHNLKGVSLNLGLEEFSSIISEFQKEIKNGDYSHFNEGVDRLRKAFGSVKEFYSKL